MKRLIFALAATAMGVALCPAAAMTIPAAASAAATTAITLKPAAGPPTITATVKGTGFGPGETVTVDFDTTLADTAVASAAGHSPPRSRCPSRRCPGGAA